MADNNSLIWLCSHGPCRHVSQICLLFMTRNQPTPVSPSIASRINTVFFAGPIFLYSLSFHLYLRISGLCSVQMSPTALPKRSVGAK